MSVIRSDSRTQADIRPLTMKSSVSSRSDGSAEFSFGDLKVLGAVTGPAEARIRDEKPNEATIELNVVPVCGLPGPPHKAFSHSIKLFFAPLILRKKYPRSLIQINLQTLSKPSDRWSKTFSTAALDQTPASRFDESKSVSEKAALINAASLALLESGIAMRGVGLAIGVAVIPASATQSKTSDADLVVLDPNPSEEACARSLHLVGYYFGQEFEQDSKPDNQNAKVAFCESQGSFDYNQLQTIFNYALSASQQIFAFVRRSVEVQYEKETEDTPISQQSTKSTKEEKAKKKKKKV
ncbi:hypothetical protein O181_075227 [Austropuccinia psidii MF-1]|uniref:Exoribonuclease phosphorolytic domain-containing protein n=1 Tax=Austropuccinia psidii MF-1 TaxID=1389203 RepID=A0A9Q3ICP8_9BASI|nr:hypothetical protein [Austropuccinia psidii MF-1]